MAWNEPGGRDPWGGKKNGDGPPDLDEVLRKFSDRINSLFGKKGNGGKGGKSGLGGLITVVFIVLLVFWAFAGFYQVDAQQRAVVQRLGVYLDTVGPGLHWNPPFIDTVNVENVTKERTYTSRGQMLTKDENIVEVPVTVQYNIIDPKAFVLRVRDPETSLHHATDSAIRHVVGSTESSKILSEGRQELSDEIISRLQTYLDNYGTGINITKVNVLETQPPREVKEAYDDVIGAKEDKDRFKNQAETYFNGVIPEARGMAQRLIQEATAYRDRVIAEAEGEAARFEKLLVEYKKAPEVTRQRLYLDTVQEVMANASKVMIDVEGGNNMMYLPLDRLVQGKQASQEVIKTGEVYSDQDRIRQMVEEALQEILRDQSSSSSSRRTGARR